MSYQLKNYKDGSFRINKNNTKGSGVVIEKTLYALGLITFPRSGEPVFNFVKNVSIPSIQILYQFAKIAYISNLESTLKTINEYELVIDKATYKIFKQGNVVILTVRGTADFNDVKEWTSVATGSFDLSGRVGSDIVNITDDLKQFKGLQIFGCGHSLAGIVIDKLLENKEILQAVSFNPAVEKSKMDNSGNLRLYMNGDPLLNIMGSRSNNAVVLGKKSGILDKLSGFFKPELLDLQAHLLSSFSGLLPNTYPTSMSGGALENDIDLRVSRFTDGTSEKGAVGSAIKENVVTALDDGDIRYNLGSGTKILKYNELGSIQNIDELLQKDKSFIIVLFLDSPNSGHWCSLLRNKGSLFFGDSYGGAPDSPLKWVNESVRDELGVDGAYLSALIRKSGLPCYYNKFDYQSNRANVATCGRWCCLFVKCGLKNMNFEDIYYYFLQYKKKMGISNNDLAISALYPYD